MPFYREMPLTPHAIELVPGPPSVWRLLSLKVTQQAIGALG